MFWVFLAVCWACGWCFENNRPILAILIGILFGLFYLADHWISIRNQDYEDEDFYDEMDEE